MGLRPFLPLHPCRGSCPGQGRGAWALPQPPTSPLSVEEALGPGSHRARAVSPGSAGSRPAPSQRRGQGVVTRWPGPGVALCLRGRTTCYPHLLTVGRGLFLRGSEKSESQADFTYTRRKGNLPRFPFLENGDYSSVLVAGHALAKHRVPAAGTADPCPHSPGGWEAEQGQQGWFR